MTNQIDAATHYAPLFKNWQLKVLGPKPTADQLASVHGLGCRPGKQALAIAMSTRDCGVTGSQIVMACGAPQLNKMRGLVADAYLREVPAPLAENGHKVYRNEVTAKGKQRIERAAKAEVALSEAGKAADAVKAPKARVVAAKAGKRASKAAKPGKVATADTLPTVSPVDGAEFDAGANASIEAGNHETELPVNQL